MWFCQALKDWRKSVRTAIPCDKVVHGAQGCGILRRWQWGEVIDSPVKIEAEYAVAFSLTIERHFKEADIAFELGDVIAEVGRQLKGERIDDAEHHGTQCCYHNGSLSVISMAYVLYHSSDYLFILH